MWQTNINDCSKWRMGNMDKNKTIAEVLRRAQDTLFTAQLGLEHVKSQNPRARLAGLRNVVVFGRSVTNVLQNLRSLKQDFDDWYQPYVKEMEADELMRFFYKLRSEILKQGAVDVHSSVRLNGDLMAVFRHYKAPPRAKGFFIGDPIGGSGWEVEVGEGETEKYYVQLPNEIPGLRVDMKIHFSQAPEAFQGASATELCERYLAYLEGMVADAKKVFQ
jgi:hypothetical protein